MKFIGLVITSFFLIITGLHLTSCKGFSQSDAQALGMQIAKSSLEVAARAAAGEKVDVKKEIALIGLQTASSAVATVTYNLSPGAATTTPAVIVLDAHESAQKAINAAAVPDPQIAVKAAEIAALAVNEAADRLTAGAATPGK